MPHSVDADDANADADVHNDTDFDVATWRRDVYDDDDDVDDDVDNDDDCVAMWFLVPPSYEECTMAGQVDIREEEDNEYVRGELRWCPKYPMYRQLSEPQGANAPPLEPSQIYIDDL